MLRCGRSIVVVSKPASHEHLEGPNRLPQHHRDVESSRRAIRIYDEESDQRAARMVPFRPLHVTSLGLEVQTPALCPDPSLHPSRRRPNAPYRTSSSQTIFSSLSIDMLPHNTNRWSAGVPFAICAGLLYIGLIRRHNTTSMTNLRKLA